MATMRLGEKSNRKEDAANPDAARMFEILRRLLGKWTNLQCQNIGPTVEWPANLPLERMIFFAGPVEGCLVLRAPERLGEILLGKLGSNPAALKEESGGEVLGEFASLYFSHLVTSFWSGIQESMVVYLPRLSDPSIWPNAKPQAAFTVLAGALPMEIRLWVKEK